MNADMLSPEEQPDRCAVCGEPPNLTPYSMAGTMHRYGPLDHDYQPTRLPNEAEVQVGLPGQVRGLLPPVVRHG